MEVEQSNQILREVKHKLEYFVRVNLVGENNEEMWFNKEHEDLMLRNHVKKSIKQIQLCGMDLQFLNYSASQIKSRSWWMYVDNHGI
jgi:hypothetical protein